MIPFLRVLARHALNHTLRLEHRTCHPVLLLTLLVFCGVTQAVAAPQPFTGVVVRAVDGDTLRVTRPGAEAVVVRLWGVDAPEKKQHFGLIAHEWLTRQTAGQPVMVFGRSFDRYRRLIADVHLREDGTNVGQALVQAGLAWWYHAYAPRAAMLEHLEYEARQARRGIWMFPDPVAPWVWRQQRAPGGK